MVLKKKMNICVNLVNPVQKVFSSLLEKATAPIIENSEYDNSEAATKVVCVFLIYAERPGMLYGNHINIVRFSRIE